jgi:hypothetical protein
MTARSTATPLAYVHDGQQGTGHILARGKTGFEASDADDKSLGVFESQKAAAAAIPVLP